MAKKSLIAKLAGIALITSAVLIYPSTSQERDLKYPVITNYFHSRQIIKEFPKPEEILRKKIAEEGLSTGNYAPEKAVEILKEGIQKAGGLPEEIDINFLYSIVVNESHWNPEAKSRAGAKGLAQIMEETWNDYNSDVSYKEVYNPEENIKAAVRIINGHEQFFSENHPNWENLEKTERLKMHAAAYNGGKTRIKRIKFNLENKKKLPKETRDYIKKVLDTYEKIGSESA